MQLSGLFWIVCKQASTTKNTKICSRDEVELISRQRKHSEAFVIAGEADLTSKRDLKDIELNS